MKTLHTTFYLLLSLLISTHLSAQMCFNDLELDLPESAIEIGVVSKSETIGENTATGTTKRVIIMERDPNGNIMDNMICGANPPYQNQCEQLEEETLKTIYATDATGCTSFDRYYLDIIQTNFSYEHQPACGTITLLNTSDPINWDILDNMNALYGAGYAMHKTYFPKDLKDYVYIVENLTTAETDTFITLINDRVTIPEGNYKVTLKMKQVDGKFTASKRINIPSSNSDVKFRVRYDTVGIDLGDSLLLKDTYVKESGDYFYALPSKAGCDSLHVRTNVLVKPGDGLIGELTDNTIRGMVTDSEGSVYLFGEFINREDTNPTDGFNYVSGEGDFNHINFLTKISHEGDFLWTKKIVCKATLNGTSIAISKEDDIYLSGKFNDTVIFYMEDGSRKLIPSMNKTNSYLAKTDTDGNFKWAKRIGGKSDVSLNSIGIDKNNNIIYATGTYGKNLYTGLNNDTILHLKPKSTNSAAFLLKFDNYGEIIWANNIDGDGRKNTYSIDINPVDNSIVLHGHATKTIDFHNQSSNTVNTFPVNEQDYLVSYSANGDYQWHYTFGKTYNHSYSQLAHNSEGELYTYGLYRDSVVFESNGQSYKAYAVGHTSIFLLKTKANGDIIWFKNIDSNGNTVLGDPLTIDSHDNVNLIGRFSGYVDFDWGPNEAIDGISNDIYKSNGYLLQLTPEGEYISSDFIYKHFEAQWSGFHNIAMGKNDRIWLVGYTENFSNTFLMYKDQCNPVETEKNEIACDEFNFKNQNYTESGAYLFDYQTEKGCDSTLTLNLTVYPSYNFSVVDSACTSDVYTFGDQEYAVPGQYILTNTSAIGCDSIYRLDIRAKQTDCILTSIKAEQKEQSIEIYPNPTNDFVHITGLNQRSTIQVFSILGTEVKQHHANSAEETLSLQHLPAGVYFVKIGKQTIQLVKN